MVPPFNHPTWTKLIRGDIEHKFKATAASMLFFNLRQHYRRSPGDLADLITEARRFFTKYEAVLADDTQFLFR